MPRTTTLDLAAPWVEVKATAADWNNTGAEELRKLLNHMHLIRAFEEEMLQLDREGQVHGPVHVSVGQEGAMVAAM